MTREHLAPAAALAYMAMALGVIPYGAPVPYAYEVVTGILGVAAVALTFTDPGGRGKAVAYWPLLAILAAWAIAAATSPAPSMSFGRIYGMALYGMCFIAVQAIAWYALSLRALMWLVVATVIACVADVGMQWWGGASLFTGQPMKHFGFHGSQGNQNDLACVSILLPLTSAALPGVPGLMLYIGLSALTAPAVPVT